MKQNVSATAAIAILFVAIILFFLVFSNRPAPEDLPQVAIPPAPEVGSNDVADMYRGLKPLGAFVLVPPLLEDRGKGLRVFGVAPDSPAGRGGLQGGDLIKSFAGKQAMAREQLMQYLTQADPKQSYPIVVDRSGKQLTLHVTGIVPLEPEQRVQRQ